MAHAVLVTFPTMGWDESMFLREKYCAASCRLVVFSAVQKAWKKHRHLKKNPHRKPVPIFLPMRLLERLWCDLAEHCWNPVTSPVSHQVFSLFGMGLCRGLQVLWKNQIRKEDNIPSDVHVPYFQRLQSCENLFEKGVGLFAIWTYLWQPPNIQAVWTETRMLQTHVAYLLADLVFYGILNLFKLFHIATSIRISIRSH